MSNFTKELQLNLSEQLTLYKEMERLTESKKTLIIKNDADALADVDRKIEEVACKALELEQKRLAQVGSIMPRETKVSEIIKNLPEQEARIIKPIKDELSQVTSNIYKLNQLNMELIESSIKWIRFSVNAISNSLRPESSSYTRYGKTITPTTYDMCSSGLVEHQA